ncbi:hypothetical protein FB45DRAFT_1020016 [Roridomyces roridus]|uniref:SET domain-containing protein n=1 Tax=Roridomyces roridus TaxID=1738132 RepID=A0AAD7CG78_9AGAR|nr:hypothetical protein FB45DRAFT_1020016 [Roridomyces roridus]
MSFGMKRGFLKQTQPVQSPTPNRKATLDTRIQFSEACRLYSENPYIVVADYRSSSPHGFLFLPSKSDARLVIVDSLDNIQAISKLPLWNDPWPSPPESTAFMIKDCGPAKSLGMFARRPIARGDLIALERPVYVARQALKIHVDQRMVFDNAALAGLSPASQASITSLHNCQPEIADGHIRGVILTNAFPANIPDLAEPRTALFPTLCRANHDCRPNAHYSFCKDTFTGRLVAVRPIVAGEEITVGYIDVAGPRAKRQEDLKRYRFLCACKTCSLPPGLAAASDTKRSALAAYFASMKDAKIPPGATLARIKELIRWAEEEGLVQAASLMSLSGLRVASREGKSEEALRFMVTSVNHTRSLEGNDSAAVHTFASKTGLSVAELLTALDRESIDHKIFGQLA